MELETRRLTTVKIFSLCIFIYCTLLNATAASFRHRWCALHCIITLQCDNCWYFYIFTSNDLRKICLCRSSRFFAIDCKLHAIAKTTKKMLQWDIRFYYIFQIISHIDDKLWRIFTFMHCQGFHDRARYTPHGRVHGSENENQNERKEL